MVIKMIGSLLFIFLGNAVADSGCIAGINSQVVKRENITFPIIDHTKSGKEYDVAIGLNATLIADLTCRNGNCKIVRQKPGILIVYENGFLTIMNASRLDEGIYKIRYSGGSIKKNETEKCFHVTVIDDDNLLSTISPDPSSIYPSTTPAVSRSDPPSTISLETLQIIACVTGVGIGVVILVAIFVINWWWQRKEQHNSDADVAAGDSMV